MEFSIIKKYTNAKGFSHDAHFNANGKYIGSVKKHDKDPIQLKPKMKQADEVQYSIIKKYTNAKGFSHDAHFNANGKYIGSVKKHGKEPIQLKPK